MIQSHDRRGVAAVVRRSFVKKRVRWISPGVSARLDLAGRTIRISTDPHGGSSRARPVHLLGRLLTCLFDGSLKVVRIDFLPECRKLGVDFTIGLTALFSLRQQLLQPKRGDRRVVIELSQMGATGFLDEFALVGVDLRFIEEPLDLGVKLDRDLDTDIRVFRGSTIVLRKIKQSGHRLRT